MFSQMQGRCMMFFLSISPYLLLVDAGAPKVKVARFVGHEAPNKQAFVSPFNRVDRGSIRCIWTIGHTSVNPILRYTSVCPQSTENLLHIALSRRGEKDGPPCVQCDSVHNVVARNVLQGEREPIFQTYCSSF